MKNLRDVIFHCGGVIGNHLFLVDKLLKASDPEDPNNPTENDMASSKTSTEEPYMEMPFLSGIN